MKRTKIFAAYLPQYHETEDNNKFWGKGYTDWVAVRKAHPLFDGHLQPKIPKNGYYYDLSEVNTIKSQAKLAREYGIAGFNIYHYWFKDGKQALQKPAELLLANKDINIEYFFTWDNSSWIRSWSNINGNAWAPSFEMEASKNENCLLEFAYGDKKQWELHFDYLLPFFRDARYLKIDNKPVFMFFSGENPDIFHMQKCWNNLATKNGFNGVYFVTQQSHIKRKKCFVNAHFIYQPTYSGWGIRNQIDKRINKYFKVNRKRTKPIIFNYDDVWKKVLHTTKREIGAQVIPSGFVAYDDTPRRGNKGKVIVNESPEKFGFYFRQLYELCCKYEKEFMLITAWNEWGEGAYLEPDENDRIEYLKMIKNIVK